MSRTLEVAAGWDKSQEASKLLQTECSPRHNMKSLEAGPLRTPSRAATLGRSTYELTEVNYTRAEKPPTR